MRKKSIKKRIELTLYPSLYKRHIKCRVNTPAEVLTNTVFATQFPRFSFAKDRNRLYHWYIDYKNLPTSTAHMSYYSARFFNGIRSANHTYFCISLHPPRTFVPRLDGHWVCQAAHRSCFTSRDFAIHPMKHFFVLRHNRELAHAQPYEGLWITFSIK